MKSRIPIFVALLGIAAVLIGWIYESRLRDRIEREALVVPDDIDYFLTGLHYRALDEQGVLDYEFRSRRLEHRRLTDISHIELPALEIYRDGERWRVDAARGQFLHRDNRLELEREVVMQRQGPRRLRLETEQALFEPDLDRLTTIGEVVMQTDAAVIRAGRAEFDLAAGIYRLTDTRAVYRDADRPG